tara:strand:+ start:324 stop:785 length:462 start_codon:yes stop_codon:yes gene_type:complete
MKYPIIKSENIKDYRETKDWIESYLLAYAQEEHRYLWHDRNEYRFTVMNMIPLDPYGYHYIVQVEVREKEDFRLFYERENIVILRIFVKHSYQCDCGNYIRLKVRDEGNDPDQYWIKTMFREFYGETIPYNHTKEGDCAYENSIQSWNEQHGY